MLRCRHEHTRKAVAVLSPSEKRTLIFMKTANDIIRSALCCGCAIILLVSAVRVRLHHHTPPAVPASSDTTFANQPATFWS